MEKDRGKILIFPDAARFLREPKLPHSRKILQLPIKKEGKLIDFVEYKKRKQK